CRALGGWGRDFLINHNPMSRRERLGLSSATPALQIRANSRGSRMMMGALGHWVWAGSIPETGSHQVRIPVWSVASRLDCGGRHTHKKGSSIRTAAASGFRLDHIY